MKSFDRRHVIALADGMDNTEAFLKLLIMLNVKSHIAWVPMEVTIKDSEFISHRRVKCYEDIDEVISAYKKKIGSRQISGKAHTDKAILKARLELLNKIKNSDLKLEDYVDKPTKRIIARSQKKARELRVTNRRERKSNFLSKWKNYQKDKDD